MKKTFLLYILLLSVGFCGKIKAQFSLDTITFERSFNNLYLDNTQPNNIWQIGSPHKILFDTTFTRPNAIVTDTLGYYPSNNSSSFIIKIKHPIGFPWSPNYPGPMPGISFTHKYNTDTIVDGGHIEYSVDGGVNWQPVTDYENAFVPSSTAPFFSGTCNFWRTDGFVFYNGSNGYAGLIDSILIKFVFTSDNINTNKEGWMIDNIIYGTIIGEGIPTNTNTEEIKVFPNPASNELGVISDESGIKEIKIYNVLGELLYQSQPLNKQSTINISQFPKGIYFVEVRTISAPLSEQIIRKKFVKE